MYDREEIALLYSELTDKRVIHRERGVIPGCLPATDSFQELDAAAYQRSIERFCKEITDYIKAMTEMRKGL